MDIGIGLPSTIPGTDGKTLLGWARRAEERGFSSLATIDRVAYPNYDSLIALAAAGAVTERIGLLTNILLAPSRNTALLAKESVSVDQISGGRLTLGFGVGGREDDFDATERKWGDRGKRFNEQLELLHKAWAGEPVAGSPFPVTPTPTRDSIPLLIGGQPKYAIPRAVRWGAGWTIGGLPAQMAAPLIEEFRAGWKDGGGRGDPRIVALSYFSLGEGTEEESIANLRHYYGFLGDWVDGIAMGAPRTPEAVRDTAKAFEDIGVEEFIFDPTVADVRQVDLLADAVR